MPALPSRRPIRSSCVSACSRSSKPRPRSATASWKPPNPFKGLTSQDVEVARTLARGGGYRADSQSPDWFGFALAEKLDINVRHGAPNAPEDLARIKNIIKTWLHNNVLAIDKREDEHRKTRRFIVPGTFHEPLAGNAAANDDALF